MKAEISVIRRDKKFKDHTGEVFSYLTAIRCVKKPGSTAAHWECKCVCGKLSVVCGTQLRNGDIQSCGCKKGILRYIKHGSSSREASPDERRMYRIWQALKTRCKNPKTVQYKYYGGRGITVCPEWEEFEGFVSDMGESYKDGLQIDRIDNDGSYSPENCRWATRKQQARNTRRAIFHEMNGKRMCLYDWCEELGLNCHTVAQRIRRYGMTFEEAISKPFRRSRSKIQK
jgi:hypothetical protein